MTYLLILIAVMMFVVIPIVAIWSMQDIDESGIDPNGDSRRYLTAMERLGVQCQGDADYALRLIEERKACGWINPEWDGPYNTDGQTQ